MRYVIAVLVVAGVATACGGNPENSAVCGFASIAGASMASQQLQNRHAWLVQPPHDLKPVMPARVVGYGTTRALVSQGSQGLVLGYEGLGFPKTPGFGVLLVDDSTEMTRGVLIYDKEEQDAIPTLGTISGASGTIPLYGMRVNWGMVSDPRCPLFGAVPTDSAR